MTSLPNDASDRTLPASSHEPSRVRILLAAGLCALARWLDVAPPDGAPELQLPYDAGWFR